MGHRGPMGARRLGGSVLAAAFGFGAAQSARALSLLTFSSARASLPSFFAYSSQASGTAVNQPQPQSDNSSYSQTVHRKTGAHSSERIRHTRVLEEGSSSPEVTQAEELIQKRDYFAAEALLRKAVADDPANYVAWFDLGFAENGLGKVDESIAA